MDQAASFLQTGRVRVPHHERLLTRREALIRGGGGFGAVALSYLLAGDPLFAAASAGEKPDVHHPARAKSVIFLFLEGGPSHIDLFDPKPLLKQLAGKPLPESFGPVITAMGEYNAPIMASPRTWKQHGQNGTWVSEWLPHLAQCVDDFTEPGAAATR